MEQGLVLPGENGAEIEPETLAADDTDHGVLTAQALGKLFQGTFIRHRSNVMLGRLD